MWTRKSLHPHIFKISVASYAPTAIHMTILKIIILKEAELCCKYFGFLSFIFFVRSGFLYFVKNLEIIFLSR